MTCAVGISIINYRTADLTKACVKSVLDDIEEIDAEIVIVDNASGDGSAEEIETWLATLPKDAPVRLVRSDTNSGFSGGHNIGMNHLKAEFFLILNSDAILCPGFLKAILAAARETPKAGIIAPQIETEDGDIQVSCFRFHSPWSELIRGAQTGPVTTLLNKHVVALNPPVQNKDIEWASFACILLRASMVDEIGPMDEGYFLYFEDSEYCLRARRADWGIVQHTKARMVHYRGGSGPVKALEKKAKRLPRYFYASRTRFFRQASGPLGPLMANSLWLLGRGVSQLRRLVGKPVPRKKQCEARDIWTNFTQPLGPRRAPHED